MSDIAKVHDIEWFSEVPRSIWKQTTVGLILLAVTFGGFGTWAVTAPLASAVVSQGSFVATGQNKIVQHLEGGIIEELLVDEGDRVEVDQPLVRLDETAALANERQLSLRRIRLESVAARLNAQVQGEDKIQFPAVVLKEKSDPDVAMVMESQIQVFEGWLDKLKSEVGLLEQNIDAFEHRSKGYAIQEYATRRQLTLLREEYEGKKILLDKGLLRNTEIKAIERAIAEAEGQIGRLAAEVAETGSQIVKQQQQITQTKHSYLQSALDELQGIQGELDTVREQSREAESVLRRITINAPVSGTVVRLYYHTSGGVIESGKSIMEILPSGVPLIIEALVPRTEIDNVKVGQHATVRLTALNRRTTPVLEGEVFYVSADSLPDTSRAGAKDVYLARIELPASELARVPGFAPTPGMPAEIMIQTRERTFFAYLTKPITDSMARAFNER